MLFADAYILQSIKLMYYFTIQIMVQYFPLEVLILLEKQEET